VVFCCKAGSAGKAPRFGACRVVRLDVVTADGEQIHCDADNHADLYWAARDAGPGFFAVVIRFRLCVHPACMPTPSSSPTRFTGGRAASAGRWIDVSNFRP
jgi:FAD/FMN-containing dehydrogenase